ncbi:complex I NDUFA9 subunit family protein [Niveispirillum lacus]|uniref:Complex I NDUFA9 subunit family protein n=1 Tax=Niveispirillum lacus TaxID=1981099 RepID=A0A255YT02_9PROT|nr:complex I NDUFA9 subunit family protein [Niveispirillum lacus]OYQ32357.1 complex I NDUFA9 subunit family protein [Niveispirillum lacus]
MSASLGKVVVFGGSGFIGRHIVQRLARTGARIIIPSRHPGQVTPLRTAGEVGQIVPIAIDVNDDAAVAAAVAESDAVINLIGILAPSRGNGFEAVQHQAAARIARAAAAAGTRTFVQMSAIGADATSDSAYASSKGAGEAAVRAVFPGAVILRPSIVFGPGDGFFHRFGRMARILPFLPLIGGGHTRFQPVYAGDVADAVMVALNDPTCTGRTYELGGPRAYSFKELLDYVRRQAGVPGRWLVTLPFPIATLQATFMELLPGKPLTRDQVRLLRRDNVVSGSLPGLTDLGIMPTALELIVPTYLRPPRG